MDEDVVVWWVLQWLAQNLTLEHVIGIVVVVLLIVVVAIARSAGTFLLFRRPPKFQRALLRV